MGDLNQQKLVLVNDKHANATQPDLATLKRISELQKVNVSEFINFD